MNEENRKWQLGKRMNRDALSGRTNNREISDKKRKMSGIIGAGLVPGNYRILLLRDKLQN
jgi:hypothetical protein